MYPRNAASPERIAIGSVVQISDGAVQTSGVTITVRGQGGAEATGGGTTVFGASGIVYYTPIQAETDFTSFVVIASKTGCVPISQTIVTTASSVAGRTVPAANSITATEAPSLANLDAAVSTRMATYTQPTGFLAATFPTTVASTTNITAGTITTVSGNVSGSVGSVVGLTAANLDVAVSTRLASASYTAPNNAGISAIDLLTSATLDATVSSRLPTSSYVSPLDAAGTRAALGMASANMDAQFAALPTAASIVAAQLTTAITESYRANGGAPTLAQFMCEVLAHLGESSIVGAVKTLNQFDHSTVAETFLLDSATAPTSIQRAS